MTRPAFSLWRRLAAAGFCVAALLSAVAPSARAVPAAITGYDVTNAVTSGYFTWDHNYTGTITPTGSVDAGFFGIGTLANYSGGTGTLADLIIPSSSSNNQLFLTAANTEITLRLDAYYQIERIEFYGGNIPANSIPGRLDAVEISINGFNAELTEQVSDSALVDPLTPFGTFLNSQGIQTDDFVDLTAIAGSTIDEIVTNEITLSNFGSTADGIFSIAEIRVFGNFVLADIPEPPMSTLLAAGLIGTALMRRRRKRD